MESRVLIGLNLTLIICCIPPFVYGFKTDNANLICLAGFIMLLAAAMIVFREKK